MIVFSDLHLREESEDVVFDEVLPGIEAAALDDDKCVAFLGDWFHIRYTISVRLFNRVRDVLANWSKLGITTTILPGNHDQINFEGRNALEAYDDIEGVDVLTGLAINKWGVWAPYRKDPAVVQKMVDAYQDPQVQKHAPPVLWMHHGVNGAMMNDFHQNTEGLGTAAFKAFDHVFCGHYHKRQVLDHVTYIGSPWQTKADEAGQPKGYGVWDGKDMTFVDTEWGKRYHRIELGPGDKLDLSKYSDKDELRIVTLPGVDAAAVGKQLSKIGVQSVVTPQVEEIEARLDVAPDSGMLEYAKAYVDMCKGELDSDRLMKVFEGVTS